MEPRFSHCLTGCDASKHTGRTPFLLDGKIAANPDPEDTPDTHGLKQDMILAIVSQQRRWAQCPRVRFPKKGGSRLDTPPPMLAEMGGGVLLELPGKLLCRWRRVAGIFSQIFQGRVVSVCLGHESLFQAVLAEMDRQGSSTTQETLPAHSV